MSHHFDSAADRADGRINLCDLYAFPGAPATTAVILTVNPDAGRSSPTTFRPDALYEFALASDGGTSEDIALRITFTEPNDAGQQQLRVLRADGPDARHGALGTLLGEGRTGEVFSLAGNGLAWVRHLAGTVARLAGMPDPAGHAARVVAAFLPDVVTYRPGQPAAFRPGDGNGRALGDNAFDTAVTVLAGEALGNASTPRQATSAFPYLSAPQPADLPPLIDYFHSPQATAQ
jgi:hypothetical protein